MLYNTLDQEDVLNLLLFALMHGIDHSSNLSVVSEHADNPINLHPVQACVKSIGAYYPI